MKTALIACSLVLSTLWAMNAKAQGFHIGAEGGANFTQISGISFEQKFELCYFAGAFAEIDFSKKWGLQPEMVWSQTKGTTTNNFNLIYEGVSGQNVTFNYLNIPVLLAYRPIPLLTFLIGPQFGILMNYNATLFANTQDAFKNGAISGVLGAQVNLGRFRLGARYFVQMNNFNNLNALGNPDEWRGQGLQLVVGIRII
jgi:Outer membrane protein beta-barrel domain